VARAREGEKVLPLIGKPSGSVACRWPGKTAACQRNGALARAPGL